MPCRLSLLLLVCAGPIGLPSLAAAAAPLAGSRPNIVLVMTDDQGYAPLGRHGNPWIQTPHLDRLYDQSTRFTRFLVSPTCAPTRSAMMTGRHPMRNGVTHTILERERLTLQATILPQLLKRAGYTSGIFGKWHLGDEEPYQPHRRGFDESFIHGAGGIGQAYAGSCADVPDNGYFDPVVRHNGTFVKTHGFCTDVFFTAAVDWIERVAASDQPFFAYLATNAPHSPYIAPEKDRQRLASLGFGKATAGFHGMIENIDTNMGWLMERLEAADLLDNTVVIFMSDNGMAGDGAGGDRKRLGQSADGEALMSYNAGMKGFKGSVDEGGVRVPFFVRWDGRIPANRDIPNVAAHIDLLPTLVELAGVAAEDLPTDQIEGRSLLPLLEDPESTWEDRYLVTHRGRWPLGDEPDNWQWKGFAVRNGQFRMVGEDQLYDMLADPGQTSNVIEDHPLVAAGMRQAYDAWWKATRPLMVNELRPLTETRPFHELYRQQARTAGIPDWEPVSRPGR
jgi:arylsulfatase